VNGAALSSADKAIFDLIVRGLAEGEQVAASGSFKLRESVLVAIADEPK